MHKKHIVAKMISRNKEQDHLFFSPQLPQNDVIDYVSQC